MFYNTLTIELFSDFKVKFDYKIVLLVTTEDESMLVFDRDSIRVLLVFKSLLVDTFPKGKVIFRFEWTCV